MHIMVNGVDTVCPEASTLLDLARQLDLPVEKLVAERNREIGSGCGVCRDGSGRR